MRSPVAIVMVGQARFDLSREKYCIRGYLRSANLGIEKIVVNVLANPHIRFLLICGREEGHLPGDAMINLIKNGVDEDMAIVGTKAQLPFLPDLTPEAVQRFREQVEAIDLVHPKEADGGIDWQDPPFDLDQERVDELTDAIDRCEARDPGPLPGGPIVLDLPLPLRSPREVGMAMKDQVDRISNIMLRMPSEKLSITAGDVIISEEYEVFIDPIDGAVVQVPSLAFHRRMKAYLTGSGP